MRSAALKARHGTRMRIAIVHDWLDTWGGAENVLAALLDLYPNADLYAIVDFLGETDRARLGSRRIRTSFIQHLPSSTRDSSFSTHLPRASMPRFLCRGRLMTLRSRPTAPSPTSWRAPTFGSSTLRHSVS